MNTVPKSRIARRALATFAALLLMGTAAQADALADIKARGKLMVGVESGGTGVILSQEPDGRLIGMDADLNAYIAKKLGVQLDMVPTAWPGIIPALLSGRFDMIMSGMTATKLRAERVDFSIPYNNASLVAAVPGTGARIKTVDDMPGKTVGLLLGASTIEFARKYSAALVAQGKPAMATKIYDDIPSMMVDLTNGNIDALILPAPIVGGYLAKRPGQFKTVEGLGDQSYFSVALRKQEPALLAAVNAALEDAKTDGTLAALQTKWLGAPGGKLPATWDAQ